MALSITNVTRDNGPNCDHIVVEVNHEGTTRTFNTSFAEIDALIEQLGGELLAQKALVQLWAAYRRARGRSVLNVVIA